MCRRWAITPGDVAKSVKCGRGMERNFTNGPGMPGPFVKFVDAGSPPARRQPGGVSITS